MKLLVFGSLNIDHTYQLPHLVREGETLSSSAYTKNAGGKGFNQAVALAKAGQEISFAGAIGQDGLFLRDFLRQVGIDVSGVKVLDIPTGHALIQVDEAGRNSIILYGGANQAITGGQIEQALAPFAQGDYILLQNEISQGRKILQMARAKGMHVILNPSPITPELLEWPLQMVDWLILNEVEGHSLTQTHDADEMLDILLRRYPDCRVVLTLGDKGAVYADARTRIHQPAIKTHVVDTTAAGDTFTGYFLQGILSGKTAAQSLRIAAQASAIAVSRSGAASSVPVMEEVVAAMA